MATVTITVTPVNDAPVAVDDGYSVAEDGTLTIAAAGVLANDTDVDGDPLSAVLVGGPSNGVLALNADGSFTYTPDPDFAGTDSFTYVANDGTVDSNVATVTITVTPVNDAPVAVDDGYSVAEDGTLTIAAAGVLANDTDIDGDLLSAVLVGGPSNGVLALNADGSFTYTPDPDFEGTDSFTYVANDGTVDSNVATVTITVTPVNDAPVAVDDGYSVPEDGTLTIAAAGVLANDTDIDGDPLSAVLVGGPSNGVLALNADGSFTYTPDPDFAGTDSFTSMANDGTVDSNVATVTITVTPVNDAPVAVDDGYSVAEDGTLTIAAAGVLANDTDIDGDLLSAVLVGGPTDGVLALNADGSFTYTPDPDFEGTDSFTYVANDGTVDSNVATVTITVTPVNDAPVAVDDGYSVAEDGTLTVAAAGVLTNDTDIDGDPLSAVLVGGPSNGVLALNADGSFTYTPDPGFEGTDSLTYVANDGTVDSNVATVTITVTPVNDAPVAVDDGYSVAEDGTLTIAATGVLANDTDVDGDLLSAVLVGGPSNGVLALNVDGSFTYTPDPDFSGTDSFTYMANDGTVDSNVATVTITVTPVNDAPVARDDSYTLTESATLTVTAATSVLSNDTDIEGDLLRAVLVTEPAHGTLLLNSDGSFSYKPDADFRGVDVFEYRVSDGSSISRVATVSVVVDPSVYLVPPSDGNVTPAEETDKPRPDDSSDQPPLDETTPPTGTPGGDSALPDAARRLPSRSSPTGASEGGDSVGLVGEGAIGDDSSDGIDSQRGDTADTGYLRAVTMASETCLRIVRESALGLDPTAGPVLHYAYLAGPGYLWQELDEFQEAVDSPLNLSLVTIGSVGTIASGFTVGYVLWVLRSGLLLSSLLAAMPAWTLFDPLAIVATNDATDADDQGEESLEELVETRARAVSEANQVKKA